MQRPDDPSRDSPARQQPFCEPPSERPFGVVNVCIAAVMLTVALGTVAIECGFYKAFDDNWFDLDRSALPSVLALLGLGAPPANVTATPHETTGQSR